MTEKCTWEEFFDAHAPVYEDNVFTKNTIPEVDFLREELLLQPGGSILDVDAGQDVIPLSWLSAAWGTAPAREARAKPPMAWKPSICSQAAYRSF
jgi:hypothetical protein